MDWFRGFKITWLMDQETFDIEQDVIQYTECKSQEELSASGEYGEYLGETVVDFHGYYDETLGFKNGKYGYLDGKGAKTANVTVYGPKGASDIGHYTGFSMSSNFKKYGAIVDGEYDVNYDILGKSGKLKSHYAINGRGFIDCINGINPNPFDKHSNTQKDGVFVHGVNSDGYAGDGKKPISTGCPLILEWESFQKQIGKTNYKLLLHRK